MLGVDSRVSMVSETRGSLTVFQLEDDLRSQDGGAYTMRAFVGIASLSLMFGVTVASLEVSPGASWASSSRSRDLLLAVTEGVVAALTLWSTVWTALFSSIVAFVTLLHAALLVVIVLLKALECMGFGSHFTSLDRLSFMCKVQSVRTAPGSATRLLPGEGKIKVATHEEDKPDGVRCPDFCRWAFLSTTRIAGLVCRGPRQFP